MSIVKPLLDAHVESTQRQFSNRHLTVGASEIGQCARKVWYMKHSPLAVESGWGAAERGNMIEAHLLVPALKTAFGERLLYAGKDQKTFTSGAVSATPDGLLTNLPRDFLKAHGIKDIGPAREVLIECKSIDPRIKLLEPKPEHSVQAKQQLGIIRETTKHRPEYCLIIYINASFLDDVREFVVAHDDSRWEKLKTRAAIILGASKPRELQPEGWIKGGKDCDYCPFWKQCTELRTTVPADSSRKPDPQFVAELADLAKEERKWNTISSEADEKRREMQEQIKTRLREKGLRRIEDSDIVISWTPIKGRTSVNMDALREAAAAVGFDVSKYESTGESTDRLTISVRADNKQKGPTATGIKVQTKKSSSRKVATI